MHGIERVLAMALSSAWFIEPNRGLALLRVLLRRGAGVQLPETEIEVRVGQDRDAAAAKAAEADAAAKAADGEVRVIGVYGTFVHRAREANVSGGGLVSAELLAQRVLEADADPRVKAMVLDIDSPGGTAFGIPELWSALVTAKKPVLAYANPWAASAAYWVASAADEIWVTPSGEVGSVGAYILHQDVSKALELEGVKPTFVSAGKFKVDGNPLQPLSEDARLELQRIVDLTYDRFVRSVAQGRGVKPAAVRGEAFGEGRMVEASRAVENGMADRVGSLADAVARAGSMRKKDRRIRLEGNGLVSVVCDAVEEEVAGEDPDLVELDLIAGPEGSGAGAYTPPRS